MQTNAVLSPAAGTEFITLENIEKSYLRGGEKLRVLEQLSLTITKGDFIALMGPSGSGKTTLLNIIAGLDTTEKGRVIVNGQDVSAMHETARAAWRARTVGFVFQFYNLIPVLTALENVALPLTLFGMSTKERMERARFALEIVGLKDRDKHFPNQLSGGQEQRVAIARAIVTDPKLIVADEPTGDLDRTSAGEVMELLRRLNQEFEKTIIMVTHDQVTANYAKQIISMDKGAIHRS
jgi:putative ABC transport system ATP-binding protein